MDNWFDDSLDFTNDKLVNGFDDDDIWDVSDVEDELFLEDENLTTLTDGFDSLTDDFDEV